MNCQELIDALFDYVGEEMVVEQRQVVEVHLAGCPHCTIRLETYRRTVTLARALPRCGLPADVEARLRAVIEPHLKDS